MSKLIQVNTVETRHRTKMLLELTDDEVVDLVAFLESYKPHSCWQTPRSMLLPRMESLLHNLKAGPSEVRVEEITRGGQA